MIKHFLITGDCHGSFNKFKTIPKKYNPKKTAIICLGDTGINFYDDIRDKLRKNILTDLNYTYYLVRGNHDKRPENYKEIYRYYDSDIQGYIYCDVKHYPNIRYLIDGETYIINKKKVLVLGGAYSPDKDYRLANNQPWEPEEQISKKEFAKIYDWYQNTDETIDVILSHTCPYNYIPKELCKRIFFNIDETTEKWLQKFADISNYSFWCFGHFHSDKEYTTDDNKKLLLFFNSIKDFKEI